MASTTPQHKRRLSNLFGTKKIKDKDLPPIVANHQVQPSTSTANTTNQPDSVANHQLHPSTSTATTTGQPDSAYASSNNPSSKRDSLSNVNSDSRNNADMVPVENNGNIEGVSSERNLAYNTSTGQVVDDDTGQVVVTTTTTTTTTMSTRTGKKTTHVDVQTQKDGQPVIAEAPGDMPPMSNMTSHSPAPPAPPEPSTSSSPVVTPMSQPVGTPQPQNNAPHRADSEAYPVPARNPMREREPMDPVSPLRPNFSYPSRTDIREDPMPQQHIPQQPMPQQQPAPRSTFANLKAAAQGLHGVGETVRGTLNNEIDTRFPRSNSQKAALANAKNQSVLENGHREMAPLNARRSQYHNGSHDAQQAPPLPSPAASEPVPPHFTPNPLQTHQQQQLSTPPPPPPSEFGSYGGNTSSSNMSQVPPSFSPESSGGEQKRIGLRKLMKRRPVPGSTS